MNVFKPSGIRLAIIRTRGPLGFTLRIQIDEYNVAEIPGSLSDDAKAIILWRALLQAADPDAHSLEPPREA